MIYRNVAREIQPSFVGGSLPLSSYSSGSSETITFNFTLDSSWDTSQISIVAMLINPSGEIDNASSTLLSETMILSLDGCTDSTAANYDPLAIIDDGSCIYCDLTTSIIVMNGSSPSSCDGFAFVNSTTTNSPITFNWYDDNGI